MRTTTRRWLGSIVAMLGMLACDTTNDTNPTAGNDGGFDAADAGPLEDSPAAVDAYEAAPPPVECSKPADCASKVCTAAHTCAAPTPKDAVQNGTETDVDCGGPSAPPCADTLKCLLATDCTSKVCFDDGAGLTCQVPTKTDGVQNGTETDVDCGGGAPTNAPKCAAKKGCLANADCASNGCNYANKCAAGRSCTPHYGGDTCGLSEDPLDQEDCCVTAPVTVAGKVVQLDKYKVTSGRMRAFLTAVNGNARAVVQAARAAGLPAGATMDPGWDLYLPTMMDDDPNAAANGELTDRTYTDPTMIPGVWTAANRHVGGTIFSGQSLGAQGCSVGSPGTHSYWQDHDTQQRYTGEPDAEQPQSVYDTKALNCVDYLIAQAFCLWDGGRLMTGAEFAAAWGPAAYPWGAGPAPYGVGSASWSGMRYPSATNAALGLPAGQSIEHANYYYSYEYPGDVGPNNDFILFISAPGRLKGRGPAGHADIVGDVMEITSDITSMSTNPKAATMGWAGTGSWEGHGWVKGLEWTTFSLVNKYGKQGLRCAHP